MNAAVCKSQTAAFYCTCLLYTSGAGLHKRGYRAQGVAAPLRETLAAAMVLLSRYRGRDLSLIHI